MVPAAGLAAVMLATAGPPDPAPSVLAEVSACLRGEGWTTDARHVAVTATEAPGLPPGVLIARIVDAPGRLVVYKDAGGRVIECGVALYDPAPPPGLFDAVAKVVDASKPRLVPSDPGAWPLSAGKGLRARYWGAAQGPSVAGVLIREGDGPAAPRLQVDSHSVLVP